MSGGGEGLTGRAAIGYDHGYDEQVFYLGLDLDPAYVEGFVEGCLGRIGEDDPEEEMLCRNLFEDETQREVVIESLKVDCEVRTGRPAGFERKACGAQRRLSVRRGGVGRSTQSVNPNFGALPIHALEWMVQVEGPTPWLSIVLPEQREQRVRAQQYEHRGRPSVDETVAIPCLVIHHRTLPPVLHAPLVQPGYTIWAIFGADRASFETLLVAHATVIVLATAVMQIVVALPC